MAIFAHSALFCAYGTINSHPTILLSVFTRHPFSIYGDTIYRDVFRTSTPSCDQC